MTAEVENAGSTAFGNLTRGMSRTDALGVAIITSGVALLGLIDLGEALWYLLVFPIWIVARDFGMAIGFVAATAALALAIPINAMQDVAHGAVGYVALTAVFIGAAAVGGAGRAGAAGGAGKANEIDWLLTARPQIVPRREVLSRRELEVMEMIATGAKNSEIADRFVISQNTVKSHVSQILKKLAVTNRTEAAYRYTELYGHSPHATTTAAHAPSTALHDKPAELGAASVVPATVSDRPHGDTVQLTLQDGRKLEVLVLDPIRARVGVGTSAIVYFDGHDRAVGWYLPELDLGVDMRHWAA
jgi:DNA-binding CsgD family transcriptional regulator